MTNEQELSPSARRRSEELYRAQHGIGEMRRVAGPGHGVTRVLELPGEPKGTRP
jgi:hypothetical protein